MVFAIKAHVGDPKAKTFDFVAQKTMYGGKHVTEGDTVFVLASENEGGQGLSIRRTALARRPLGRRELRHLTDWNDGEPGTELNFKFYRQATNKIVGLSDSAAAFLASFFR